MNLADLLHPRPDWFRLRVLIERLPDGFDGTHWTVAEHLAAASVDALATANWQRSGKGSPPKPLPRPGDPTTRGVDPAKLAAVDEWRAQWMPTEGVTDDGG